MMLTVGSVAHPARSSSIPLHCAAVWYRRSRTVTRKHEVATQIHRVTFASMVGERIRSNILDGTLPPGSQLNEVELASSFGVSRGPVREALQRLIQEGLLRSEPHRSVFVPVMTDQDIDDVYLAREALETAAIRRIARMGWSASAFKALDSIVSGMRKAADAGNWQTVANRDLDFHTELVSAAASPRLERMFTTVISETHLCLSVLTGTYNAHDDLVDEHRRVSELIRDDDADAAVAVLKKHFDDAVLTLKRRRGAERDGAEVD
jgi:DNA-binding GntR family transcriptional regulator